MNLIYLRFLPSGKMSGTLLKSMGWGGIQMIRELRHMMGLHSFRHT